MSEYFSLYEQVVPGLCFSLVIIPEGSAQAGAAPNHSPRIYADEGALIVGGRALANLAVDYMLQTKQAHDARRSGNVDVACLPGLESVAAGVAGWRLLLEEVQKGLTVALL